MPSMRAARSISLASLPSLISARTRLADVEHLEHAGAAVEAGVAAVDAALAPAHDQPLAPLRRAP